MFYAQSTSTVLSGWCLTKLHLFLLGLEDHVCLLFRLTKERGYSDFALSFNSHSSLQPHRGLENTSLYHFPYFVSSPVECMLYGQYKSTIFRTSCHPHLSARCMDSTSLPFSIPRVIPSWVHVVHLHQRYRRGNSLSLRICVYMYILFGLNKLYLTYNNTLTNKKTDWAVLILVQP